MSLEQENEALKRANVALREALEGLIPDPKYTGRGVERGTACGRNYLGVNGVVVAMEGDICRSVGFGKPNRDGGWDDPARWTQEDFDRIEREFRAPLDAALATDAGKDSTWLREKLMRVAEAAVKAKRDAIDADIEARHVMMSTRSVMESARDVPVDLDAIVDAELKKVTP